jgi:hypothetical protein
MDKIILSVTAFGVVVPFCVIDAVFPDPIIVEVIECPGIMDVPFAPLCNVVNALVSPVNVKVFVVYLLLTVLVIEFVLPITVRPYV